MRLNIHNPIPVSFKTNFNKEGGIQINIMKYYSFKDIRQRRDFEIESNIHITDDYPLVDETIIKIFALIL